MSDNAVEICQEKLKMILSKFKAELCHNPDADLSPYKQMLVDEYSMMKAACIESIIKTLLLNLYACGFWVICRCSSSVCEYSIITFHCANRGQRKSVLGNQSISSALPWSPYCPLEAYSYQDIINQESAGCMRKVTTYKSSFEPDRRFLFNSRLPLLSAKLG